MAETFISEVIPVHVGTVHPNIGVYLFFAKRPFGPWSERIALYRIKYEGKIFQRAFSSIQHAG